MGYGVSAQRDRERYKEIGKFTSVLVKACVRDVRGECDDVVTEGARQREESACMLMESEWQER